MEKFTQFINLALKAGFGVGFSGWDPIALDLDGDGSGLVDDSSEFFGDETQDGFAELAIQFVTVRRYSTLLLLSDWGYERR